MWAWNLYKIYHCSNSLYAVLFLIVFLPSRCFIVSDGFLYLPPYREHSPRPLKLFASVTFNYCLIIYKLYYDWFIITLLLEISITSKIKEWNLKVFLCSNPPIQVQMLVKSFFPLYLSKQRIASMQNWHEDRNKWRDNLILSLVLEMGKIGIAETVGFILGTTTKTRVPLQTNQGLLQKMSLGEKRSNKVGDHLFFSACQYQVCATYASNCGRRSLWHWFKGIFYSLWTLQSDTHSHFLLLKKLYSVYESVKINMNVT